jgi:DNA-binding CsgD family transcriptional regulator
MTLFEMDVFTLSSPNILQVRVLCAISSLAVELSQGLELFGWNVDEGAELILVIDGPWGSALMLMLGQPACRMVVLSDNPCPEYWEDLWDCGPQALLIGGHSVADITKALARAQAGGQFRQVPRHDSTLTLSERRLLRLTATGLDNIDIASKLHLTVGTVKNGLNRIFDKLHLNNRTQAALYYWGLWHLLEGRN